MSFLETFYCRKLGTRTSGWNVQLAYARAGFFARCTSSRTGRMRGGRLKKT